jgi:hypothetical protein
MQNIFMLLAPSASQNWGSLNEKVCTFRRICKKEIIIKTQEMFW